MLQELSLHKSNVHLSLKNSSLYKSSFTENIDSIIIDPNNYFIIDNGKINNSILQTFKVCKFWKCPISEQMINLSKLPEDMKLLKDMSFFENKDSFLKFYNISDDVIKFIFITFKILLYDEDINIFLKYLSLTDAFLIINNVLLKKEMIEKFLPEKEEEKFHEKQLYCHKFMSLQFIELYHFDKKYGNTVYFNIVFNSFMDTYKFFFINLNGIIYLNEMILSISGCNPNNILEGWDQRIIDNYNEWKSSLPDNVINSPINSLRMMDLYFNHDKSDGYSCELPSKLQKIFAPNISKTMYWSIDNIISYMYLNMLTKMGSRLFDDECLDLVKYLLWNSDLDYLSILFDFPMDVLFENMILVCLTCNNLEKLREEIHKRLSMKDKGKSVILSIHDDYCSKVKILTMMYNFLKINPFNCEDKCRCNEKLAYLKSSNNYWKEKILDMRITVQNFTNKNMKDTLSAYQEFTNIYLNK